jgi:hypothetical protein
MSIANGFCLNRDADLAVAGAVRAWAAAEAANA